jgi:hypothetical protein
MTYHCAGERNFRPPLTGRSRALLALLIFVATCAAAANPRFTSPLPSTQRVFVDNINLTAEDFFSAYMSSAVEQRRYAELYLLGVLDATEGLAWCDYRRFKTVTVGEEIFSGFKALDPSKQKARAAHVIVGILSRQFPCQVK